MCSSEEEEEQGETGPRQGQQQQLPPHVVNSACCCQEEGIRVLEFAVVVEQVYQDSSFHPGAFAQQNALQ
jgi:hypothetical protein